MTAHEQIVCGAHVFWTTFIAYGSPPPQRTNENITQRSALYSHVRIACSRSTPSPRKTTESFLSYTWLPGSSRPVLMGLHVHPSTGDPAFSRTRFIRISPQGKSQTAISSSRCATEKCVRCDRSRPSSPLPSTARNYLVASSPLAYVGTQVCVIVLEQEKITPFSRRLEKRDIFVSELIASSPGSIVYSIWKTILNTLLPYVLRALAEHALQCASNIPSLLRSLQPSAFNIHI